MTRFLAALALGVFIAGCRPDGISRALPELEPLDSPVDFGELPVLNEKTMEVRVANAGRAPLTLFSVTLGTDDGIFRLVTAPEGLQPGGTDVITVAFKPTAQQAYTSTLVVESDDADSPRVEVELKGAGSTVGRVEVMPTSLDFSRVPECAGAVQQLTILSTGTADLLITDIAFEEGTHPGYGFVGSTRTPATVKPMGANGLTGQLQLTVRLTVPPGAEGTLAGAILLSTTDPDHQVVRVPLTATVNRAPVAVIGMFGNGAPGAVVTLDGTGSSDPDGDVPLTYKWALRSKPLASTTAIAVPTDVTTSMQLDPQLPGAYEVQLDVTDAEGVKSCQPARSTVVAAPAQKLLIELFWDNPRTDLDLHVLKNGDASLFSSPGDCFFQNRAPRWGPTTADDPELVRDALTGYGPELFGYRNPIDSTYRVVVVFQNDLLAAAPASTATVRVYHFGVLKAELSRAMQAKDEIWEVADVTWPSGVVTVRP
ncbi:MAG: choice-of-anchor D domain-containing protein [Archangium sp.]|nr:choice-of-anchor D domain-containing protein [Archangium sp.]